MIEDLTAICNDFVGCLGRVHIRVNAVMAVVIWLELLYIPLHGVAEEHACEGDGCFIRETPMWKNSALCYGWGARVLHWLMVPLLFGMVAFGFWMTGLTYYDPWYHKAPALHEGVGAVAFLLFLWRLVWRWYTPPPPLSRRLKPWEKRAAHGMHILLYLLMGILPITGYLITTAKGRPVDLFGWFSIPALWDKRPGMEDLAGDIHLFLGALLVGLACVHVGAACKHHFVDRDDTLLRMLGTGYPDTMESLSIASGEKIMITRSIKIALFALGLVPALLFSGSVQAAKYAIDPTHSFIEFRILHLGYSVLKGRFNTVRGTFHYDENNPGAASISVEVETASVDSNHAKRDKHLRGADFLEVEKYPLATFKSTSFREQGRAGILTGDLTLHGVTQRVEMPVELIGAGPDPWGGKRRGYQGRLQIKRSDYGISYNLGPASEVMTLELFIEGIQK